VCFGDLTDDREPEAGPRHSSSPARTVEAIEHVGEVILSDAGAVIANHHLAVAYLDLDLCSRRAPLGGVVEEIGDRALDRPRNTMDDGLVEVSGERDPRPVAPRLLDRIRGE
jgi:hypothetical protein